MSERKIDRLSIETIHHCTKIIFIVVVVFALRFMLTPTAVVISVVVVVVVEISHDIFQTLVTLSFTLVEWDDSVVDAWCRHAGLNHLVCINASNKILRLYKTTMDYSAKEIETNYSSSSLLKRFNLKSALCLDCEPISLQSKSSWALPLGSAGLVSFLIKTTINYSKGNGWKSRPTMSTLELLNVLAGGGCTVVSASRTVAYLEKWRVKVKLLISENVVGKTHILRPSLVMRFPDSSNDPSPSDGL